MYNFKRGIDWAADSTGATLLANHCWVDGIEGDDTNSGLAPTLPFKTITQAKATFGTSVRIVLAPARYVDQVGTVGGSGDQYIYIGDSLDQDVILVDSLGVLTALGIGCESLTFIGYSEVFGNSYTNSATNCEFVDCGQANNQKYFSCKFINTPLLFDVFIPSSAGAQVSLESCTLINSNLTIDFAQTTGGTFIAGTFADAQSTFSILSAGPVNIIESHFENKTTWDVTGVNYGVSNTDGDPYIYDLNLLNYSIDPLLSPLFGRGYAGTRTNPLNLAGFYTGQRYYTGVTEFDAAIAANPNLEVSNNELINTGPNDVEYLETPEILLDSVQVFGAPHKVGILNYLSTLVGVTASANTLDRTLEIKFSTSDLLPLGNYEKFRFGEMATVDDSGKYNGESGYSWAQNNALFVRKFQARVGIVKLGVV